MNRRKLRMTRCHPRPNHVAIWGQTMVQNSTVKIYATWTQCIYIYYAKHLHIVCSRNRMIEKTVTDNDTLLLQSFQTAAAFTYYVEISSCEVPTNWCACAVGRGNRRHGSVFGLKENNLERFSACCIVAIALFTYWPSAFPFWPAEIDVGEVNLASIWWFTPPFISSSAIFLTFFLG